MPRPSIRINGVYFALLTRAGLLVACAVFDVAIRASGDQPDIFRAVPTALLLFVVAALTNLPMPSAVPRYLAPVTETLTSALVVGALGANGDSFLAYLAIPMFAVGMTVGTRPAVLCAIGASVMVIFAPIAIGQGGFSASADVTNAWVPFIISVAFLSVALRRLRETSIHEAEPAYADAHRLLSELHVVARQLSLGLDPQTLAVALSDDLGAVMRHGSTTVLARSTGGRFVPLVGLEPPGIAESAMNDAWVSAQPVRRQEDDGSVSYVVIPVLMGERVVALVVLATPSHVDDEILDQCRQIIERSGPRLASAMLFEDVRRLATVDERKRLAREIHDGVAQDLASVGYALDDIASDAPPQVAERVVGVRSQLREMVADLRMSIFDLRAGVDDTMSIGKALSEYAHRTGSQNGTVVHVSIDEGTQRLPIAMEVELLRIAQEAITNVRRHARARNLWLAVAVEAPHLRITVADDGRGLQRGRPDSIGITGMHERAKRIGADLRISSTPGTGTVVEVTLAGGPPGKHRISAVTPTTLTLPDTEPIPVIVNIGRGADQEVTT